MNARQAAEQEPAQCPVTERYRGKARCPWCESTDVRLASLFGGTVSELLFQCGRCHSAFGVMKWETLDEAEPSHATKEA